MAENNRHDNLILIGMPGVGKSTVGIVLAKVLGMSFVDSDLVIQQQTGRLLKELIAEHGQEGFLQIEDRINASLDVRHTVIATGGSAVYGAAAMTHLRAIGTVVYLALDEEALRGRLGDLTERGVYHRPGQSFHDIYIERAALYESYADVTVWEDGAALAIDRVIEEIRTALNR